MKEKMFMLATTLIMAGTLSLAYAADADKGKALFESPTLGGGTTGKSCVTCHEGGKNLGADLFERQKLSIMDMDKNTIEDVINVCIEKPLGGKAIAAQGEEMQDLIAYMKTLVSTQGK